MVDHPTERGPGSLTLSAEDRPIQSQPAGRDRRPPEPPAKPPKKPRSRRQKTGRSWLGRILSWSLVAAIWAGIALVSVLGYYALDLPDLSSLTATLRKPSVTILASDGEQIAAFGDVYGDSLSLEQMPPFLPQAVLATEDRHFFQHFGLDPIGLLRASLVNLRAGHFVQGGSTITQQLAKNLFLSPEKSLKRKMQELLLALWLEHKFSKQQILTLYLNRVYLGSGTWGVDAAARRYFDRPATELSLYQCALLGGLMKAPSRYNPQNDRALSLKRTSQVLANMVAAGSISQEQADQALRAGQAGVKQIAHTGRYFADWIHDQVAGVAGNDQDIVVHTTLDMALQRRAEAELDALLSGPGAKAGVTQGAMVVMTPDGAVRALVGGRNYAASQFNRATQGMRQPGSAFKAFLYLAALEQGLNEEDPIEDSPITAGKYRPENYSHKYEGEITLRHAFAKSSNVAAVRLIEKIGPRKVIAVAKRLGITSELRPDASLALGTSEASLLEMTAAFASFANGGEGVFAYGYPEIVDSRGGALYSRQGGGTGRVIAPGPLRQMTDMMVAVVEEGTGKGANFGRPAAGKTGTTQDYRDAWFIGFTADYVAGVWLGNDDGTPLNRITGGSLPTQLWHNVMAAAHQGLPVRPLPGLAPPEEATSVAEEGRPAESKSEEDDESIWSGLVKMLGGGSSKPRQP
jgi:penicillin-binding protein 1A